MAVYYFTRFDLDDAIGRNTVNAVFCDDNSEQASIRAVDACRAYGTSECKSFLRENYPEAKLPETEEEVPDELRFAALDFGLVYVFRRRPELVRAMGEESWTTFEKSAIEKMKRYAAGIQRVPPTTGTPENVEQSTDGGPDVLEGSHRQVYFDGCR